MQALLAQLSNRIGDVEGNAARAADALRSHPDVDIAVFPELFLSGYTHRNLDQLARPVDAGELRDIAATAKEIGTAVVIGFAEQVGDDGVANSVACIDHDGTLAGVYRKTHLFASEAQAGFIEGEELLVVELAGRRVAPLICFDIEFPEPARQATLAGAELLVTASANMDPFYIDHAVGSVARAHENRRPHLYANPVGEGDGLVFVGASRSIAPTGETLVEGSRDKEELLVVPVAELGGFDERTDYPKFLRGPLPVKVAERAAS
ncbi:MAG: nitrilase-related carbon-nitrogen hydrolase [Thermoleophilaceae bacterium]